MVKYLLLFRGADFNDDEERVKAWDAYIGRLAREGKFVSGLPFGPSSKLITGAEKLTVDLNKNNDSVSAYIIIRAASLEEAIECGKLAPNLLSGGSVEVRSTIPPVQ